MSNKVLENVKIVNRNDTPENWAAANPVLLKGEPGLEIAADGTRKLKYGDGVNAWNDLPYFGGDPSAAEVAYENAEYPTVAAALDKLLYVDITVTKLTASVTTAEMGATIDDVNLEWDYTGKPTSVTLDNAEQGVGTKSKSLTGLGLTANKTWTVRATDGQTTGSRNVTLSFLNGVYYGVGTATGDTIDNAFVQGLTKVLTSSRVRDVKVNAAAGQHIYYALPTRLGTPVFYVGGFEGGFNKAKTFEYTNPSGYAETYDVWQSTNAGLGDTTVTVK